MLILIFIKLFLEGTAMEAYGEGGFSQNADAVRYLTREFVEIGRFSPVWFGSLPVGTYDLIRPEMLLKSMNQLTDTVI